MAESIGIRYVMQFTYSTRYSFYIFFTGCVLLLVGCTSYHVFPREYRESPVPKTHKKAFVENPELKQELEILQDSEVYILADSNSAGVTVRLDTMKVYLDDINGGALIGFLLTLGLGPLYTADRYKYGFVERNTRTGEVEKYTFELKVAQRTWLLNVFQDAESKESKLGEALRAKMIEKSE